MRPGSKKAMEPPAEGQDKYRFGRSGSGGGGDGGSSSGEGDGDGGASTGSAGSGAAVLAALAGTATPATEGADGDDGVPEHLQPEPPPLPPLHDSPPLLPPVLPTQALVWMPLRGLGPSASAADEAELKEVMAAADGDVTGATVRDSMRPPSFACLIVCLGYLCALAPRSLALLLSSFLVRA